MFVKPWQLFFLIGVVTVCWMPTKSSAQTTFSPDFNFDGTVNQKDLIELLQHNGSKKADQRYGILYDLDQSGAIDRDDILLFLQQWDADPGVPPPMDAAPLIDRWFGGVQATTHELKCLPGGTPSMICNDGLRICYGNIQEIDGRMVQAIDLELISGAAGSTFMLDLTEGVQLTEVGVTQSSADVFGLGFEVPAQTITMASPVILARSTIIPGDSIAGMDEPIVTFNLTDNKMNGKRTPKGGKGSGTVTQQILCQYILRCHNIPNKIPKGPAGEELGQGLDLAVGELEGVFPGTEDQLVTAQFAILWDLLGMQFFQFSVQTPVMDFHFAVERVDPEEAQPGDVLQFYENPTLAQSDRFGFQVAAMGK